MKFCTSHWADLRAAIDKRGLSHLVAQSGRRVVEKTIAELSDGGQDPSNFDPLMAAHNMIVSNTIKAVGLAIMFGDQCPICFLVRECGCGQADCPYTTWIDRAADDARTVAIEKHLLVQA